MKNKLLLLIMLIISLVTLSQNSYHDTQGKLEISNSGQAIYTLPIALPPSIQDVGPTINLVYASGKMGGIAGQGWNINTISAISRISTRRDIDGYVDGVDFDSDDKLALDGQRLILTSGAYWAIGSTYTTEVQTNAKVELIGSGTTTHFIVTQPDGSRSWYGNFEGIDATDLTSFYITRFEDSNGNFITYHYNKPLNKSLCISEIKFSANINGITTPQNKITFTYIGAKRIESGYIKGLKYEKAELLSKIQVYTTNLLFREYRLTHIFDSQLGYERVSKIQEFNGALESANPVIFNYDTTTTDNSITSEIKTDYVNNLNFNNIELSGDFDGDGKLDFIAGNQLFVKLFNGSSGQAPIVMPFSASVPSNMPPNTFVATTNSNNKLNQFQSVVKAFPLNNGLTFKIYNLNGNTVTQSYTKTVDLGVPNSSGHSYDKFLEGDFNGDGISEVLIMSVPAIHIPAPNDPCHFYGTCGLGNIFERYYILDLNQNSSTIEGSSGLVRMGTFELDISSNKNYVADFNGDGKSDILSINTTTGPEYGKYKIYSFDQSNFAPWIKPKIIGSGLLDKYSDTKQILFGDYNGDGKTDIMLPDTEGGSGHTLWHIYYSNPQLNNGIFFVKESHNIAEYWPNTGSYYNTQIHLSNYYALDANGDGKSDLVRVWRKYYKPNLTINNHDTQWKVFSYANNIGNKLISDSASKFTLDYQSSTDHDNGSPDMVVPVVSSYNRAGITSDLVLVHNHYNKAYYINFTKDIAKDIRISSINSSYGGGIVDNIYYSPMEPAPNTPNNHGTLSGFYSSLNSANYPFVEIKMLPNNYLVSSVRNTVEGITRKQEFKYNGLVVNLHGLGVIGFNKVARSNWYELNYTGTKLWSATENRFDLRGATERTYTSASGSQTFSFVASNLGVIPNAIHSTTNLYSAVTLFNIYKLQLNTQTVKDFLTNVSTETNYTYDSDGYLLPTVIATKNYTTNPSSPIGSTNVTTIFENNAAGLGANYYLGRPKEIKTVTSAYGNTYSTIEKLTYVGNKLVKKEKKGNTTDNKFLVEEFTYFPIGNIKNKKIYTTGYTEKKVIAPRITEYTYDATQRFIKTFKDIEGLISSNISYHPLYGEVTKSQNAFGLATSTFIDNWGKVYKITDYLGKHTNITYSKTGSDSQILKVGDDGSSSMSITDILGRTKKAGVLDIDNDWSYTTILYDVYGRKHQKSEPHDNLNNPSQWTTYSYDDFNRESSIINNTGLTTTITYSGLTVTATDGIQTTSSTKNANGHIISSSDNGGTITYQYFANGNLKNTNYNGTNILMEYDEWGRKSLLNDPSAGIYTYSYNPLGEILVETTPNGTTTSTYDSTGKLLIKHTEGLNTQDYITYSYDPISKLTNKIEKEDLSGSLTTNEYFYDAYNRLIKTNEAIYDEVALYEKKYIYDDFGRLLKEYSSASLNNKSSSKWIRNTYKRGVLWQIFDDATNHLLWQTNSVNQRGQLTNALLGNEIAIANTYDNYGYPTRIKHDLSTAPYNNVMTVNTTFEPQRGNLTHRDNNLFSWSENFSYDNLDRLTNFKDAQGIQVSQQYEIDGRISNNAMGTYNYSNSNKKYQNTSIDMNAKSKAYYENRTGLFNDDMESKNTWEIADPSAVTYDTTTPAHSGNTSLKIVNSSTHEKIVHSNYWVKIDNGTPTEYTYSAWVKSDGTNPQAEIFLFMKSENESGYFTLVDNKSISTSNNWVLIEKKFLVPAHIKNLSIRLDNNAIGNLWFDDVRIRKSFTPSSEKNLNISYNAFKSPIEIEETNVDKISFTYNINNSRSSSYYGGLQTDKYQRQYRKYYSADGAMEIKHNTHTNSIEFVTYIGGDGYTAPIILKSDGTTHQYNYLHRDHQGSILAITDQSGTIIEKRLFDAWGEIIKIQDGQHKILLNLSILDRGYTGHEHLESVGLINMNGRLYDSNLHRLLQPDNYVQDLNNTQNYNRYSYAFNNPLKYTDPDGENPLLAVAVGVFMGAATYTITAMFADIPFTVGGLFKASYIGAVSGAITFGIGEGVATIKPLVTRFSAQALAHGTSQGMISGVQGGDFWQGFASGSLSSIASGLYNGGDMANGDHWAGLGGKFAGSSVGILSFGSISGGAGAVLTGGNFWQGAAAGLTVSGLNHAMHSGFTKKYDLNVLADYEGAEGAGHQALAGELENKKLQYISKDGTYENAGIYGKSNYTDEVFNTINEINDYYGTYISPGKSYDVVATYRLTRSQMNTALTTARSYAHQTYNLFTNSCTTIVEKALYNAFKPQYTFFSPIPNITFQNQQFTYRDYLISVKNIN